jgi:ribosomal protein S25
LGRDFQKWKNKRHSPDIPRKASTEGNLENIEEFVRVEELITVNEIVEKLGLSRGSVPTVIHKDLQFKYASVTGAKRTVAKRNYL